MIASVNGIAVGYDDVGSGLPVVYLHGYPHDRTLWSPQLSALTVPTRALACDLRGFGESKGAAKSVDDYADDAAALLRHLDIKKAVVVGLSMGGYAAFALWRRAPSLVRGLVLADTKAGTDNAAGKEKRNEQIAMANARGSGAIADMLVPVMVGKTTREQRPEIAETVRTMLARAPVSGIVGALTAMRDRPDSSATLATINIPTLIVAGEEDVLTPPSDARAMHDAIPGSRLEIIAGAGHLSNLERPAAFNHVLSEFFVSLAYM